MNKEINSINEIFKDNMAFGRLFRTESKIIKILEDYTFRQISEELYVNGYDNAQWTIIMYAVLYKFLKVIDYLLYRGVDTSFESRSHDYVYNYRMAGITAHTLTAFNEEIIGRKRVFRLIPDFWRVCRLECYKFIVFPLPQQRYNIVDEDDDTCPLTIEYRDVITITLLCDIRIDFLPTELILKILSSIPYYEFVNYY